MSLDFDFGYLYDRFAAKIPSISSHQEFRMLLLQQKVSRWALCRFAHVIFFMGISLVYLTLNIWSAGLAALPGILDDKAFDLGKEIVVPFQKTGRVIPSNLAGSVVLQIEPTFSNVLVGETFTETVKVIAGSQFVDGVLIYLDFDPTLLRVKQVSGSPLLPLIMVNAYNNSLGRVDFGAWTDAAVKPSGSFTILTIQFEALALTPSTKINYHNLLPRKTEVTYRGNSLLVNFLDGKVAIVDHHRYYLPLLRW